jgi:hypothetical protein
MLAELFAHDPATAQGIKELVTDMESELRGLEAPLTLREEGSD